MPVRTVVGKAIISTGGHGVTATVHNRVDTVVAFLILTVLDVVDDRVYD